MLLCSGAIQWSPTTTSPKYFTFAGENCSEYYLSTQLGRMDTGTALLLMLLQHIADSGATCVVTAECPSYTFRAKNYCEKALKTLAPILLGSLSVHSCRPQ